MTGPQAPQDDAAVVPPIHIEDQGPPDQYGRVDAIVRIDGVPALRMQYAAWHEHLVLYETHFEEGAPEDAEVRTVEALLDLYADRTPKRLTHSAITSQTTLRWYQDSHLRPGLLLCGSYGTRSLFYDPVGAIDLSEAPEPVLEGYAGATLTLMYVADLRAHGEVEHPTLAHVYDWLVNGDPMGRFAAIRRLVVDPVVDPLVKRDALYLGMLNENAGVRQFAAIHLSGYFPELGVRPDVLELNELLRDPHAIYQRFGHEAGDDLPTFNVAQSRRNARYAIAWTLGNLCWNAAAWGATDWAEEAAEAVRDLLVSSAARFDAARDAWLYQLAIDDFADDPEVHFALGTPDPVDLFDFLRFGVLRWGIVEKLGFKATDRFYWLSITADGIVGRAPTGEPDEVYAPLSPAAHAIYAPAPSDVLPQGLTEIPAWMYGRNHYDLYAPIEVEYELEDAAT